MPWFVSKLQHIAYIILTTYVQIMLAYVACTASQCPVLLIPSSLAIQIVQCEIANWFVIVASNHALLDTKLPFYGEIETCNLKKVVI